MSLPSSKAGGVQQKSIRSFFQPPKAPQYAPPPGSSSSAVPPPPAPPRPPTTTSPSPPPPIPPPVTSATNPTLPKNATIRAVEPSDIPALRRLNSLLLPVAFPDSFYAAVLDPALSHRHSRVITWAGDGNGLPEEPKIVGAIVCIPEEQQSADSSTSSLYIRSLGILAPYRALGLANAALDDILAHVSSPSSAPPLRSVTAHVWTENEQGLAWYLRRGFEPVGEPVEAYYRRLRPGTAILMSRPVRTGGVLRAVQATQNESSTAAATDAPPSAAAAAIVNRPPTTSANLNSDARPPPRGGGSYQNQRSEMEWNDLPVDMALRPPRRNLASGSEPGSGAVSGASSRSSSSAAQRKKRDRSYPAAAFGS
ncbi:hypothetical protein LMH87_002293 [Akanthomyces muscarius]|uniref:N-acetyltransferase domain-containing protein n=1 Tax=Akanthomyces muscarius TaxID=2231603 RepID=A0A9W8UJI0_AKAMU|nr:hypothetical protein LMH87_002293 [Akanthomyces muscarius]KAJ4147788.1 hypothetical protein LMH87_002293 [Akanthomyces muscarius]